MDLTDSCNERLQEFCRVGPSKTANVRYGELLDLLKKDKRNLDKLMLEIYAAEQEINNLMVDRTRVLGLLLDLWDEEIDSSEKVNDEDSKQT